MVERHIRVPESGRRALAKLLGLLPEEFEKLSAAYSSSQPLLDSDEFSKEVAQNAGLDSDDVEGVTDMILALTGIVTREGISHGEVVEDIVRSYAAPSQNRKKVDAEQQELLKQRLQILLSKEHGVGIVAKAVSLLLQNERRVTSVQILTDARPIFTPNSDSSVAATLVMHTLRVSYMEDGRQHDFYAALTSEQLAEFRDAFNRAENKAKAVAELMGSRQTPVLE